MKHLVVRKKQVPVEIMSTMGCRTQNGADVNALSCYEDNIQSVIRTGKLNNNYISAAQKDGRGNICPVTIILPTIAMEAIDYCKERYGNIEDVTTDGIIKHFMILLDQKIYEARDMLLERFEYICSQPAESAKFMYENGLMAGYDGKTTRSALCHGTLALG